MKHANDFVLISGGRISALESRLKSLELRQKFFVLGSLSALALILSTFILPQEVNGYKIETKNSTAAFTNRLIVTKGVDVATAKLQNSNFWLEPAGIAAGQTSNLRFFELAPNGANSVALKSPDNLAGDTTWTLPAADGTANQALSTNGAGILSWQSVAPASGSPNYVAKAGDTMTGTLTIDDAGGTNAALTEAGIDRSSAVLEAFNIQNSGAGSLNLNLLDGGLQTATVMRLTNSGALQNIASISGSASLSIATSGTNNVSISTNGLERIRVDSVGNVGIGTASPSFPFDLQQDSTFVGSFITAFAGTGGQSGIVLRGARGSQAAPSTSLANDVLGSVGIRGYGSTGFSPVARASILGAAAEGWTDTAQGTYLSFLTTAVGTTTTSEKVRITAAGDVGVGANAIPNPASRLHVDDATGSPFRVTAGAGVIRMVVNSVGEVGIGAAPATGVQLDVAGVVQSIGSRVAVKVTTGPYSLNGMDEVVVITSTGGITLLGSGAGEGRKLTVRNNTGASLTINPGSGTTINGGSSLAANSSGTWILSGTVWYLVGS